MTKACCYIQRAPAGILIESIRLHAPGLDRTWTPPSSSLRSSTFSSPPTAESAPAPSQSASTPTQIRSAAQWIRENLQALNLTRLDTICIDAQGGICTWLSATSTDPKTVAATLTQAAIAGPDAPSGSSGRLAMRWAGDPASAADQLSIQALAQPLPTPTISARKNGVAQTTLSRFGLVSIPDACVRVFIDALDEMGIEVGRVISIWHALAQVFDSAASHASNDRFEQRIVAASALPTAALLIDSSGRLNWAWSLSTQAPGDTAQTDENSNGSSLIAGGSMRLKRINPQPHTRNDDLEPDTPSARRLPGPQQEIEDAFECAHSQIARLALDWLAWSAQLGQTPQRVICIAPSSVSTGDPAANLAQLLSRAWPGAAIDVVSHDDPIGLILTRLCSPLEPSPSRSTSHHAAPADPRRVLTALTTRPGKIHRAMHHWIAAAIAALAFSIAVVGYFFHHSASVADKLITDYRDQQEQALAALDSQIPNLSRSSDPVKDLKTQIGAQQQRNAQIRPPHPILPELLNILDAIAQVRDHLPEDKRADLKIVDISFSPLSARVELLVPDAETGPSILLALRERKNIIPWTDSSPPVTTPGKRRYVLSGVVPPVSGGSR